MNNHPFEKLFYKALKKSTPDENLVLKEATSLRDKGYPPQEIYDVLKRVHDGLLSDEDQELVAEAMEEVGGYL